MNGAVRVNVGCGATPTPGWLNLDNSLTVRLARVPALPKVLYKLGLLSSEQLRFVHVVRRTGVRWADATRRIPLPDCSAEVVYCSHMLEHLEPTVEVPRFLAEVRRVLAPGGIVRIAVPDLLRMARRYLETGDADEFVRNLRMSIPALDGLWPRFRFLIAGFRGHRSMYDGASVIRLLERHGFCDARILPPGETMIPEPGCLNLREREDESVYVEATSPDEQRTSFPYAGVESGARDLR